MQKVISRLTYKMDGMFVIKTKKIKKPPSKIGGRKTSETFLYSTVKLSIMPQETSYLGQNAVKTVD